MLPAIALTTFDKERDEKKAMRLSCVEGVRAEKNRRALVAMAFAGAVQRLVRSVAKEIQQ